MHKNAELGHAKLMHPKSSGKASLYNLGCHLDGEFEIKMLFNSASVGADIEPGPSRLSAAKSLARGIATQKYIMPPRIMPQQLRHPTCSLVRLGIGDAFVVRSTILV